MHVAATVQDVEHLTTAVLKDAYIDRFTVELQISSITFAKSRPEDADAMDCQVAMFEKDEVAVRLEK